MNEHPPLGRRLGRPKAEGSEALNDHILETAVRLFSERGYAGTSIEQIAAEAGAGKPTIYRRYPSKQDLFKAVIEEMCRKVVASVEAFERDGSDPLSALRSACLWLLEMSVRPPVVDTYRILIAEAPRFPSLVEYAVSIGNRPLEEAIARLVHAATEAGQIAAEGGNAFTADALIGLITGTPLRRALMGDNRLMDEGKKSAFFEAAWSIFLNGSCPRKVRGSNKA